MSVEQLPAWVREFVNYLDGLLARLDQSGGWCGVFWQRDPEGMQACLDGREVPPWDVVEALLHDLAGQYGPGGAGPETERARALHAAALAAYDARPGGRDALGDRLDVMLREQRYAAERQAELGRLLASATSQEEADAIRLDLAWARDDHERATARCAELRARTADLDRRAASAQGHAIRRERVGEESAFRFDDGFETHQFAGDGFAGDGSADDRFAGQGFVGDGFGDDGVGGVREAGAARNTGVATDTGAAGNPGAEEQGKPAAGDTDRPEGRGTRQRKRRRGSARFAGFVEEEVTPVVVPPTAEPVLPVLPAQPVTGRRTRGGARFAGARAGAGVEPVATAPAQPQVQQTEGADRRAAVEVVETLVRLRGEERSGEAHALLVEASYWPAERIPLLAAEMQRFGLGADWATLLWEAASLPAERLVAAADALTGAGRAEDGEQILRQGVGRPAHEIGQAVVALAAAGRHREIRALLDAYVRVRTPEEAARSAAADPDTLVPLLLAAAQGVSDECRWDLVHALRVAGHTA